VSFSLIPSSFQRVKTLFLGMNFHQVIVFPAYNI
jgi:hypothetical protein